MIIEKVDQFPTQCGEEKSNLTAAISDLKEGETLKVTLTSNAEARRVFASAQNDFKSKKKLDRDFFLCDNIFYVGHKSKVKGAKQNER